MEYTVSDSYHHHCLSPAHNVQHDTRVCRIRCTLTKRVQGMWLATVRKRGGRPWIYLIFVSVLYCLKLGQILGQTTAGQTKLAVNTTIISNELIMEGKGSHFLERRRLLLIREHHFQSGILAIMWPQSRYTSWRFRGALSVRHSQAQRNAYRLFWNQENI